jgi:hypothetical protein
VVVPLATTVGAPTHTIDRPAGSHTSISYGSCTPFASVKRRSAPVAL